MITYPYKYKKKNIYKTFWMQSIYLLSPPRESNGFSNYTHL